MGSFPRSTIVFLLVSLVITAVECVPLSVFNHSHIFDVDIAYQQPGVHHREPREAKTGRGNSLDTWACETVIPLPDDIRAEFPLDPFYQKYTHAYGIPIISSDNCGDAAVIRACYTVRFLLADRKDIRDSMFDQYGRVGVIAKSERTTEIPEHSHMDSDVIDDRARGLGGVPNIPITTNAEENLVCGTVFEDRWSEEDILIHEFAHAIHLISLQKISSTFDTELGSAYTMAKTSTLWQDTYAISKVTEYFAEGVQAFFNVQVCRSFTDYIHNTICTRETLKAADPQLYELISKVFPCENIVVDRCETDQGLAAAQFLRMNCEYEPDIIKTESPEPTTRTEATDSQEPSPGTEATESPEPNQGTESTDSPEPSPGTEATESPEPNQGTESTDSPEPSPGTEATESPEPNQGTESTDSPEPSPGTEATESPEPNQGTESTDSPEPSPGTEAADTTHGLSQQTVSSHPPDTQTTSATTTSKVGATNLPRNDAIKIAAGVIVPIVVISAVIGLVFAHKYFTTKMKVTASS
ncbi:dextranase-like isoform X2 [Asterias rubens]|uniref:dextranase-like isoform X2 n=1 Tax=Asterias rubens TaxID=7604 RepID=UPI00145555E8|nr:dextranase-like isoform X2 [Asterias rubens]